jgi:putative ABC transport system substrate-binding protein
MIARRDRLSPARPRESGDPALFAKRLDSRWSLPPTPIGGGNERRYNRRKFITLLAGAAAVPSLWPIAARAQQAGKLPTIGMLNTGTPSSQAFEIAAFVQRLRELNWIEGRTVAIEQRYAEGHAERYAAIAAELVRLKVDVIVTGSTPGTLAAKQATSLVPIVFAAAGDPVGNGLVASLARPGGNLTGLSQQQPDTAGKRLGLLREAVPALRRLAILVNPENPAAARERDEAQAAALALGLECIIFEMRRAEDIARSFEALKGRAEAVYVCLDPLVNVNRTRVATLAVSARLPTMHQVREPVEAGGLMSYGPSFPDMYRRAAELADKILRGTKPGDIPVEQPTKFELVVNLTTAKAVGVSFPDSLLAIADEVIE